MLKVQANGMAVGQHQRLGAELADLAPDPRQLLGFSDAGMLHPVHRDRRNRRLRPVLPDRIDRIAVDGDQLGAGLGAGGGQTLGCRKSVQPRIKSEAVTCPQVCRYPAFRRGIGQGFHGPGPCIDLLGRLDRVAAIDEQCGLVG
ncbi:hypothetical protein ACVWW4_007452 [Bradyrhizobium sp. LB7.1]